MKLDWLQPESGRGSRRRSVALGIVIVFAFLAAAVTSCGSSDDSNSVIASDDNSVIASSTKPDLADLSDAMVITESEFPPVPDGKFEFTPVQAVESLGPADEDKCDPQNLAREGDQATGATVTGESTGAEYGINIARTRTKTDLPAWANDCLPHTGAGTTFVTSRIDLPGLPPGTISVEDSVNDAPMVYLAFGYVRGVLVGAYVVSGDAGMPAGAKSDLVTIFNNQAERLESY